MKRLSIFSALAFTLATAVSTASANTVNVTVDSFAQGSAAVSTMNPNVSSSAGMFDLTINSTVGFPSSPSWLSPGAMIKAFCVELTETLSLPSTTTYNIQSLSSYFNDATQETNIAHLFGNAVDSVLSLGTAGSSAGFQLALWELVYEDSGTFNMDLGDFTANATGGGATATAANNFADSALSNLMAGGPSYEFFVLSLDGTQDLIIWNETTDPNVVSAPAMIAMSLFGMGFIAFRRRFS